ncbi:MAG TPA: PepSY domain-containing protein [Polyangiaceae bacterium]|nr:PepSY domain-containing protein [Polyangiaceae bacterium]
MARLPRALLVAHRYLGIGVGPFMIMWCLSGIIMMYVPYPRLPEAARRSGLGPIDWSNLGSYAGGRKDERVDAATVEMLAGRVVLRADLRTVDLANGTPIGAITPERASAIAADFAAWFPGIEQRKRPEVRELVRDDTWTFSGIAPQERPLYRIALGDRKATEIYVSSVTGRIVQATTRRQRVWSWFGSVPHWIYVAALRRHARLWNAVVVFVSACGSFLTVFGIVLGVSRWKSGLNGRRVRDARRLHHLGGLVFGIATLTWVASGLLSMNPGGLFENRDDSPVEIALLGSPPAMSRVTAALRGIARSAIAARAVSVEMAPLGGNLYFVIQDHAGRRVRVDESARPAPLTQERLQRTTVAAFGGAPVELLPSGDDYFLPEPPTPVYRVIANDAERIRYYLDPISGKMETSVGPSDKKYRWLHDALHKLDAPSALRTSSIRWILMIALLAGAAATGASGLLIGIRHVLERTRRHACNRGIGDR